MGVACLKVGVVENFGRVCVRDGESGTSLFKNLHPPLCRRGRKDSTADASSSPTSYPVYEDIPSYRVLASDMKDNVAYM